MTTGTRTKQTRKKNYCGALVVVTTRMIMMKESGVRNE